MSSEESERFEIAVRGQWSEDPPRDERGFKFTDPVYLGETPGILRLPAEMKCEWLVEHDVEADGVIGVAGSALAARVSGVSFHRADIRADAVEELARFGPTLEHVSFSYCTGAPNAAAGLAHLHLETLGVFETPLELLGELPRRLDLLVVTHVGSHGRLDSMDVITRAQPRNLRLWLPLRAELVAHALLIPQIELVDVRADFDADAMVAELERGTRALGSWPRTLDVVRADDDARERLRRALAPFSIVVKPRRPRQSPTVEELARSKLPSWPPRDVEAIYSTIPEREPKVWAAQFGTDFVAAWDACPEPDWLLVFAFVVSSACGDASKARVVEAMLRALDIQDQIAPSQMTTDEEREAFVRARGGDPAAISLFRSVGGGRKTRPNAEVLQEIRSSLDGREMLREAKLIP